MNTPPIVFLHGGALNRVMWKPVIALLEAEYSCAAIDLPGHGTRASEPFTVEASVEIVIRTIASLPSGRAVLVGLSLGGYIAQATAATRPDLVAGILIAGATIRYTGWAGFSTKAYGWVFPLLGKAAAKAFPNQLTNTVGTDLAAEIVAAGLSMRAGAAAFRRLPGRDYAATLRDYPGPIVVVNGERDKENVRFERVFIEQLPAAKVISIPDAGHASALQQPADFADAVVMLMKQVSEEAS